jgi:hypothetical protein
MLCWGFANKFYTVGVCPQNSTQRWSIAAALFTKEKNKREKVL